MKIKTSEYLGNAWEDLGIYMNCWDFYLKCILKRNIRISD